MAMTRTKKSEIADTETVQTFPIVEEAQRRLIKYRKKPGGGSFRMRNGKIIKPNQVFEAFLDEIPKAFMDQVECLEPLVEAERLEVVNTDYKIMAADENGKFNVLNSYDKVINEIPLTENDAKELIAELNK